MDELLALKRHMVMTGTAFRGPTRAMLGEKTKLTTIGLNDIKSHQHRAKHAAPPKVNGHGDQSCVEEYCNHTDPQPLVPHPLNQNPLPYVQEPCADRNTTPDCPHQAQAKPGHDVRLVPRSKCVYQTTIYNFYT